MQVSQKFTVGRPADEVWTFLSDVRAVAACVPGLELVEERPDGTYVGRFAIKVGPLSAKLEGEGTLARDDQMRNATLEGRGVDKRGGSRVKGVLRYRVMPDDGGSAVEVDADMTLSGPLAQVGRTGIIEDVARVLTKEFSANLEERLAAAAPVAAESSAPAPGGTGEAPPAAAASRTRQESPRRQEFDAGRALSGALWRRIANFFRRLFGRS